MHASRSAFGRSTALALGALLGALAPPRVALAEELRLQASALLGSGAQRGGWRSVLVHVENRSPKPISGKVHVQAKPSWGRNEVGLDTVLPFSLAPGARASLEAPTHGYGDSAPLIQVRAVSPTGDMLAEVALTEPRSEQASVIDLTSPSRIAPAIRGMQVVMHDSLTPLSSPRTMSLGMASAPIDDQTGDLALPALPSAYASVALVLGTGRDLARADDAEKKALADWVLAGGALALWLDRPEDPANPLITALLGATVTRGSARADLGESRSFHTVPEAPGFGSSGIAGPGITTVTLAPSEGVQKAFVSYEGGNLRQSAWGASASYGLGEVHLLAFDPNEPAAAADPWVARMVGELARHAIERTAIVAIADGRSAPDMAGLDAVRRELDPNQAARWTIAVSAIVLLLYATLAGPVGFYLAGRRGRPLRALLQLPIWSALTMSVIVMLGLFARGVTGRARRLTVVEAGAGMPRAAAVHFRGFYAASSGDLTVRPTRREHVLDLAGSVTNGDLTRRLLVDRDGLLLEGVPARPWETVLVREDGFQDLGQGVSLTADGGGHAITNRAGRDLIGVVLRLPSGDGIYFRRIKHGETRSSGTGKRLGFLGSRMGGDPGSQLDSSKFASELDLDFPGLGRAWGAFEPLGYTGIDWWPDGVPVLIAELEGGDGRAKDAGLTVDYDRTLLRVVGNGGS